VSKGVSQHFTSAAAGKHQSYGQMHGSGFPRAVRAEEAEDFATFHAQGKSAQRRDPLATKETAVMLADIVKRKGRSTGHEWIKDITGQQKGLRRSEGLVIS
jgi:hypothetical protein